MISNEFVNNIVVALGTLVGAGTVFLDTQPSNVALPDDWLVYFIFKVAIAVIAGGATTALSFWIKWKCNQYVTKKAKEKSKNKENGE